MMRQLVLLIRAEGAAGPVHQKVYGCDDSVHVRDLATRVNITISAQQISPYRHTLFLDGQPYRIMNVIGLH